MSTRRSTRSTRKSQTIESVLKDKPKTKRIQKEKKPPLKRYISDPSLRKKPAKTKSEAPPHPTSQDESAYSTKFGNLSEKKAKIISWNINGINAWTKKEEALDYLQKENAQIVCLQETKANKADIEKWSKKLGDQYKYKEFLCCSTKKGYSGVAILSKVKPVSVHHGLDGEPGEGRVLIVEFAEFLLCNTYVVNSGMKLDNLSYRQEWDALLQQRMSELSDSLDKPVLWTGDLNVCHTDWDVATPDKRRNKVPGVTDEERAGLDAAIANGFVDVWRQQHLDPKLQHYTYWSYKFQCRQKNLGYRLDYWMANKGFDKKCGEAFIRSTVLGSDHCPIGIVVDQQAIGN